MNLNIPTKHNCPEVPGIDDCDWLFHCCSRDGQDILYFRAQEFDFEGKKYYALAATRDVDASHYVTTHEVPAWACSLEQVANWLIADAREIWGRGRFCQCSDTKKYRTI